MDSDSKAIMMAWEKPLMEAHAKAVCSGGGHILNIGFGMGLVDTAIQQYNPAMHTIVEAHPEVYERMIRNGWGEKDNVKIVFGRWQDVLSQLGTYDGKSTMPVLNMIVFVFIFLQKGVAYRDMHCYCCHFKVTMYIFCDLSLLEKPTLLANSLFISSSYCLMRN
jgi:hypothetical protein